MDVLVLRFDAPLMSFGAPIVDRHGVIQPYPALSMITGLLGNALGYNHAEHKRLQRLQERLGYASRQDRRGRQIQDYQTVDLSTPYMQDDHAWTTRGELEGRKGGPASSGTHIRLRDYWAEAIHTVALTLDPADEAPTLDDLERAVQFPARPLFIGRKPCLPAVPLFVKRTQAGGWVEALSDGRKAPLAHRAQGRGDDGNTFSAWWPSGPEDDRARPVTDQRDWANQIHVDNAGSPSAKSQSLHTKRMMPERNGNGSLHMVQLWLDAQRLVQLGHMLDLFARRRRVSTNYLVHCALGELFQDQAPGPFCVEDAQRQLAAHDDENGRLLRVLGYSSVDRETLHEVAKAFASPSVYEICQWDRLASKPMPGVFPKGLRLRFELRACPVVRKSSSGPRWKKGQELDAFLSHVWEINDPRVDVDREVIYRRWLKRQLDIRGGADARSIGMDRFSIERMTRRTQGSDRKTHTIQRPDVTLAGTLTVTDGPAFVELLRNGIGRHKSFGFGMLKIRRA